MHVPKKKEMKLLSILYVAAPASRLFFFFYCFNKKPLTYVNTKVIEARFAYNVYLNYVQPRKEQTATIITCLVRIPELIS